MASYSNQPRPLAFNNPGYLPNGASGTPAPGATPLLPNNGRVIQSNGARVLCVADVRGNLKSLNDLAEQARADYILHTGDFGFYDESSLERIAEKTLKHVAQYSPLLPDHVKRSIAQSPPGQSIKGRFPAEKLPLSELPLFLNKSLNLRVPVYTVWGACEDVRVLEKFRSGEYKVNNLHIIDEASSRLLDVGGVKLRLLGLGGAVVMHKLFDNGEGKTTIAGGQGTMWTTLLQMGELVDTANRVYDPTETRIFVTHASPAREGLLNQLSVTLKADFSISAGLHFRYGSSYNEFSVNPTLDHYRGKLAASKASFTDVWETVKSEVEPAVSQNEAQKTLLDNALDIVNKMPTVANGGNPFGGPVSVANAGGQVDESAFKNMWNFNLADAAFGWLVLEVEGGRIGTEMRAQGFNFAHRGGKPTATQATPTATSAVASPAVSASASFGVPTRTPSAPGAPPVNHTQQQTHTQSAPQSQQPKPAAAPARTNGSPVPAVPNQVKPATPQPSSTGINAPAAADKSATTLQVKDSRNGNTPAPKPADLASATKMDSPIENKKPVTSLFVLNMDSEQGVRDSFPEDQKSKISKIEKYGMGGKYFVVHFETHELAKEALDAFKAQKEPQKANVKWFEDRGSSQRKYPARDGQGHGGAGTWQASNRGPNSYRGGYQSGASDSEGGRRGGFGGRGRGRTDRGGRGGRSGRGNFTRGGDGDGTTSSPAPTSSTPAPTASS
ncbi:MAG: hypothetical protein M1834_003740 [Cirrosporium novae-zelandiae]|nr:MAG: hypothetical protein M1834_003740 [Cirrosporium novae-zelandiae]